MTTTPLEQFQAYVRYRLSPRVGIVRPWRVDELTRLVIWHWPHRHLEAAERAGGRHHRTVAHAMALVRAQVREQWEARQGMGPLWKTVLGETTAEICDVVNGIWWSDPRWRARLEEMRG